MLEIEVPDRDLWDESKEEFISIKGCTLHLEHSLVSLSKWESKWCKAFLSNKNKTEEEQLDYVRCMTLDKNVDPRVYEILTNSNIEKINDYIAAPMTATRFFDEKKALGSKSDVVTSELIYYWMIALNIPVEFEKWHLTRLITLIKVCNVKNNPKKMSRSEVMRRNKSMNAARKKRLNTKG